MSWDGQQRHSKGGQRETVTGSATANYCTTEQIAKHSLTTHEPTTRACVFYAQHGNKDSDVPLP